MTDLVQARAKIATRLRLRRVEIEQATQARVHGVSDPRNSSDPEYTEGLRAALSTALDYALAAAEAGEEHVPPIPVLLLAQAQLAARHKVGLDTVLRRYVGGYTLLTDFLAEEAEHAGLNNRTLKHLLRGHAAIFDRLIVAVTEAYAQEQDDRLSSPEKRRLQRVKSLLAGEPLDAGELAYPMEGWHLGVVAAGSDAASMLKELASGIGHSFLLMQAEEDIVWSWFGSRQATALVALEQRYLRLRPPAPSLALGEPGKGARGWRLTHLQAQAALPIARRSQSRFCRYSDVALLASMSQDDLLLTSLRELYLLPLAHGRNGGEVTRRTLRAYFDADCNVTSTAAALGINRHTVTNRLKTIEERIGHPLSARRVEIDIALRLEQLGWTSRHPSVSE